MVVGLAFISVVGDYVSEVQRPGVLIFIVSAIAMLAAAVIASWLCQPPALPEWTRWKRCVRSNPPLRRSQRHNFQINLASLGEVFYLDEYCSGYFLAFRKQQHTLLVSNLLVQDHTGS